MVIYGIKQSQHSIYSVVGWAVVGGEVALVGLFVVGFVVVGILVVGEEVVGLKVGSLVVGIAVVGCGVGSVVGIAVNVRELIEPCIIHMIYLRTVNAFYIKILNLDNCWLVSN